MAKIITCAKLKKEAEALDYQPYPGEIGVKIMNEISAEAWNMWVNHQTMLINEMRLTPVDPKRRFTGCCKSTIPARKKAKSH